MSALFKYRMGFNELRSKESNLLRALLSEFVAIFMLNLFGCMAATHGNHTLISLAFGFVVFTGIMTIGHISGGHMSPTVTIGLLSVGKISIVRAALYIAVQCVGAIAGSCCLKALLPLAMQGGLGHTKLAPDVEPLQGLGIEFFLGFLLMISIFGIIDDNKAEVKYTGAFSIGCTVALAHFAGIKFTGASVNGARTLGSAVATGYYDNLWVYWIGPSLGAICAALLYTQAFMAPEAEYTPPSEQYRTNADEKEMTRLESKRDMA